MFYDTNAAIYDFAQSGDNFQDGNTRVGSSFTVNFDDDGILTDSSHGGGNKTIWAIIRDINGYIYLIKKDIVVTSAQVNADFTYTLTDNGVLTVTDTSYDAETWSWNFGDGTTSTLQNPPPKSYSTSGTKTITLTVSNGITTDSISKTVTISIIKLPVRWLKFEFKATQTRANSSSPWDKELPFAFLGFIPTGLTNFLWPNNTTYDGDTQTALKITKGTVDAATQSQYAEDWTGSYGKAPGWTDRSWYRLLTDALYSYNTSSGLII